MDHTSSYEADTIVGSEAGACPTKSAMLKEYGDRPIKTVVILVGTFVFSIWNLYDYNV
jgi:hypothetical protein